MFESIEIMRRNARRRMLAVGTSIATAALISGCSWVPDALNPVEWYRGIAGSSNDDVSASDIASPRRSDGKSVETTAQGSGRGLAADRDNAKYASASRREPAPTKQLARRTVPAPVQTAAATPSVPVPAPAPVAATPLPLPPGATSASVAASTAREMPSLDRPMRTARDEGPNAAPTQIASAPPPRPNLPETVPTRRSTLVDHYQQRLTESSAATTKSGTFDQVPPSRPDSSYAQPASAYAVPANAPITYRSQQPLPATAYASPDEVAPVLIPPRGVRGAKGAVLPPAPAASFQVASFYPDYDGGLSEDNLSQLRNVAALNRRSGGVIRLDGSVEPGTIRRVVAALGQMGVSSRKIRVAPGSDGIGEGGEVRISIDY
ncbi:hypothetical protein [Magnetospirillum fulvum]|uniref:Uncharacterized protein n=1 Tax=Magnetospirillum fulvum TaxID=1082 RepID=A0A1H6GWL3_MAGFU|nr:hypothetical protein [Magnetospirillum fulvum]SEH27857.1 hypothetical protein SAMN04244559_00614 [Magnetospirillum fulvum]